MEGVALPDPLASMTQEQMLLSLQGLVPKETPEDKFYQTVTIKTTTLDEKEEEERRQQAKILEEEIKLAKKPPSERGNSFDLFFALRPTDSEKAFMMSTLQLQRQQEINPTIGILVERPQSPDPYVNPLLEIARQSMLLDQKEAEEAAEEAANNAVNAIKKRGRPYKMNFEDDAGSVKKKMKMKKEIETKEEEEIEIEEQVQVKKDEGGKEKVKNKRVLIAPLLPDDCTKKPESPETESKWEQLLEDPDTQLGYAFPIGKMETFGPTIHSETHLPHYLCQKRAPINYIEWYGQKHIEWAEYLTPWKEVEKSVRTFLSHHFVNDRKWIESMKGGVYLPCKKLAHIRDASHDARLINNMSVATRWSNLVTIIPVKIPFPTLVFESPISDPESRSRIWGTQTFPVHDSTSTPVDRRGAFFPPRDRQGTAELSVQAGMKALSDHRKYIRVRTTMPGDGVETTPGPWFLHGSLETISDWYGGYGLFDRYADINEGHKNSLTEDDSLLDSSWGNGLWGDFQELSQGGWEQHPEAASFIASMLVRISALRLPDYSTVASPWKDKSLRNKVTSDKLALDLFERVHMEHLSVLVAELVMIEICSSFRFEVPYSSDRIATETVKINVLNRIATYVCTRYYRLRRMQSFVSSFGEYMFGAGMWNVVYRPLRTNSMWIKYDLSVEELKAIAKKNKKAMPHIEDLVNLNEETHEGCKFNPSHVFDHRTISPDKPPAVGISTYFYRDTMKYLWSEDTPGAEESISRPVRSVHLLYAMVYARSFDSFTISRKPVFEDDANRIKGDEIIADDLPECILLKGGKYPETTITWNGRNAIRSKDNILGYNNVTASKEDEKKLWINAALHPLSYERLYLEYAQDLFMRKGTTIAIATLHRTERGLLPWCLHNRLAHRDNLEKLVALESKIDSRLFHSYTTLFKIVHMFDDSYVLTKKRDGIDKKSALKVLITYHNKLWKRTITDGVWSATVWVFDLVVKALSRYDTYPRIAYFIPRDGSDLDRWLINNSASRADIKKTMDRFAKDFQFSPSKSNHTSTDLFK